jgi:hypothetical protein
MVEFLVIQTDYPVILGYPTLAAFNLVQINSTQISTGESGTEGANGLVATLLDKYSDLFNEDLSTGPADVEPMKIELVDSEQPLRPCKVRRQPVALQKTISEQVQKWLDQGVIRESNSPYNSGIVMAKKKDGSYRLCVDYRALNARTVPLPYPMHSIGTVFERVAGSKIFCKLDLANGFLQIPLDEDSAKWTAFSTEDNHFEFVRTPFGLRNSPLHFQRVMNRILGPLLHHGVEVFVDDNLVHADTEELLLERLEAVFGILRKYGLKLNSKKCVFMARSVEFLGHQLSEQGIAISPSRLESLRILPQPQTVHQLRQFLGSFNYVRDYLDNFATVAQPLFNMLGGKLSRQKHRGLVWNEETLSALEQVRALVDSVPLLTFVNPDLDLILETDASDSGVGGVLFQLDEQGQRRVISFVSRAFAGPSLRWSTSEKEAFAIYFCVTKLRHFLLGRKFTVRTDHRNLLFVVNSDIPKIQRWALRMQEYDMRIEHIAGTCCGGWAVSAQLVGRWNCCY